MKFQHATIAALLTLPVLGGCATRGWVRTQMTPQRSSIDSAASSEHSARLAAESALGNDISGVKTDLASVKTDLGGVKTEVASLRTDLVGLRGSLDSMRTDFGARITAFEEGIRFAFPIHFAFNDANVRDTDQAALERFAAVAQKYYPGAKITIEGFADPAGGTSYNKRLSLKRADAVRNFLQQKGLGSAQLASVGYGETRLVVPGAWGDKVGAELNRRVVFVIEAVNAETGVAMK
jgi:peptidoglycan-associated lipoprotein